LAIASRSKPEASPYFELYNILSYNFIFENVPSSMYFIKKKGSPQQIKYNSDTKENKATQTNGSYSKTAEQRNSEEETTAARLKSISQTQSEDTEKGRSIRQAQRKIKLYDSKILDWTSH
jgi:hypothetical protein